MTNHFRELLSVPHELTASQLEEVLDKKGFYRTLPTFIDLILVLGTHRAELKKKHPRLAKGTFRKAADLLRIVKGKEFPSIQEVLSLSDTELKSRFNGVGDATINAWDVLITLYMKRNPTRD